MAGLGRTFGRGAMTNQWTDMMHTKLLLIFSNPAENHPGSSVWVTRALDEAARAYVIEPRRTRLAAIVENRGGKYIRIRPGTDIAFINGMVRYVISKYEDGTLDPSNYLTAEYDMLAASGLYKFDNGSGGTWPNGSGNFWWPVYTDAGFKLNASRTDYARYGVDTSTPDPDDRNYAYWTANPTDFNLAVSLKLPIYTGDITHPDSVFQYLKSRVDSYTPDVVVDICGRVYAGQTPFFTEAEFVQLCEDFVNLCWAKNGADWGDPNYSAATILYAMGTTQHTHGAQNIRDYAILQLLGGNMGRAGGGVNALRGIGNVQGSTDIGLLKGLIPGYSGPPGGDYDAYIDGLFGNSSGTGLQQQGFKNMTYAYFKGDPIAYATNKGSAIDDSDVNGGTDINDPVNLFGYWPGTGSNKVGGTTNKGLDHRTMFVQMNASNPGYDANKPKIRALVAWGQNPVQSESGSGIIRNGLKGLELLVVVDMFLSETAQAEVGASTEVYFLPAAGFAEKAGTYTNSSRVVQWKWQVAEPKGNSKTDFEMLALLAYELIQNDALNVNTSTNPGSWTSAAEIWDALFASQYGFPADPWTGWDNTEYQKDIARDNASGYAELVYRQMCAPMDKGGCLWIYASPTEGAYDMGGGVYKAKSGWTGEFNTAYKVPAGDIKGVPGVAYDTPNHAQRRVATPNYTNGSSGPYIYDMWGFAWLLNRRIFYNRGKVPGDAGDLFVPPDKVARIFVQLNSATPPTPVGYSNLYRKYSKLADGSTPVHIEPKESPRPDLAAIYQNTTGIDSVIPDGYATVDEYPLVLTTVRYVEHYQGGLMSRNVPYLTELVPEPILEISSVDAAKYGLVNGGLAYIKTKRSEWAAAQGLHTSEPYLDAEGWVGPFRVRIIGTRKQRVAPGIVAVPFHWGSAGLNTGPSANLLTNDAQDPNTNMPESKSCLCAVKPG